MKLISSLWQMLMIFIVSIICLVFCGTTVSGAQSEKEVSVENFEYAITPDDPQWEQMESVEEKIEACRIPEDV